MVFVAARIDRNVQLGCQRQNAFGTSPRVFWVLCDEEVWLQWESVVDPKDLRDTKAPEIAYGIQVVGPREPVLRVVGVGAFGVPDEDNFAGRT